MRSFKISSNDGREATLIIGEVTCNSCKNIKSIEVVELKVGEEIKARNKTAYIAYSAREKNLEIKNKYIQFANSGTTLEITNPGLLQYLKMA